MNTLRVRAGHGNLEGQEPSQVCFPGLESRGIMYFGCRRSLKMAAQKYKTIYFLC